MSKFVLLQMYLEMDCNLCFAFLFEKKNMFYCQLHQIADNCS